MNKNWSTNTFKVKITIESLEIPCTIPGCVSLIWDGHDFQECSDYYHFKLSTISVDKSFTVQASRTNDACAILSIQAKNFQCEFSILGETGIVMPSAVFDGTTNDAIYQIPTDLGTFNVTINFKILPDEDVTDTSSNLRDLPNMKKYSALINKLSPTIFTPSKPSDFWGNHGLISELQYLSHCRASDAVLNDLDNLGIKLHKTARDADFYSMFLQTTLTLLMEPPLFITLDEKAQIVQFNSKYDPISNTNIELASVVAIKICYSISNYLHKKSDTMYLEMPLIDICGSLTHIINDSSVYFTDLIHIISLSSFVMSYINQHHKDKLPTVINAFLLVEKNALITYLKKIRDVIQKRCNSPSYIASLVRRDEKIFSQTKIPTCIWEDILSFLYKELDFYVAAHWISNAIDLDFNGKEYFKCFPNIEFPYIKSIHYMCKYPQEYLMNKKLKKGHELFLKGNWLYQALTKVNDISEMNLTDSQILKKVKNPDIETTSININTYIQDNTKIDESTMQIPITLPELPKEYR